MLPIYSMTDCVSWEIKKDLDELRYSSVHTSQFRSLFSKVYWATTTDDLYTFRQLIESVIGLNHGGSRL